MNYPWLIQRIERRRRADEVDNHDGIDRHFGFDYMGSSEFEWGALPSTLKRMREAEVPAAPIGFEVGANRFWFVGDAADLGLAKAVFEDQLGKREMHLKECTFIGESCDPLEDHFKMTGWWNVDSAFRPWAVFLQKADAECWLAEAYRRPRKVKSKSGSSSGSAACRGLQGALSRFLPKESKE